MKLMKDKKGANIPALGMFVGVIALFFTVSSLAPTIVHSANNMSASGLPLASLYENNKMVFSEVSAVEGLC